MKGSKRLSIVNRLNNAFKTMDLFIKPSPTLLKRIMIVLDKKMMDILYDYGSDDYYLYEFYRLKLSARKTFIGESNGQRKISLFFNNTDDIVTFENKIAFYKAFAKYLHRDWLSLNDCTFQEFCDFCKAHSNYIKKPANQFGGIGIEKQTVSKDANLSELYNKLKGNNYVIEEIVIQDKVIAEFNPSSVNTIRVYSVLYKSKVIITTAFLRMGVGDVVVDNFDSGGIGAKIDIVTGIIITPAKNKWAYTFHMHPYTNKQIIGFEVPRWAEIKEIVKEAAFVVPAVRYVAWDIVINNKGDICFIEGNERGGFNLQESVDLQGKKQMYKKLMQGIE